MAYFYGDNSNTGENMDSGMKLLQTMQFLQSFLEIIGETNLAGNLNSLVMYEEKVSKMFVPKRTVDYFQRLFHHLNCLIIGMGMNISFCKNNSCL